MKIINVNVSGIFVLQTYFDSALLTHDSNALQRRRLCCGTVAGIGPTLISIFIVQVCHVEGLRCLKSRESCVGSGLPIHASFFLSSYLSCNPPPPHPPLSSLPLPVTGKYIDFCFHISSDCAMLRSSAAVLSLQKSLGGGAEQTDSRLMLSSFCPCNSSPPPPHPPQQHLFALSPELSGE